jgi:hypothetical protein
MRGTLVTILLVICAQSTRAQSAPEPYRPMEFLVGSCWTGAFPNGKATDEKCFEWVFDRKFIRERHVVCGQAKPYAGETIFAWDPREKRIAFTYLNSLGGISTGWGEDASEGLVFPERHVSAGNVREMKAVWKRSGADAYSVSQAEKVGDGWKTLWTMELKRTPFREGVGRCP